MAEIIKYPTTYPAKVTLTNLLTVDEADKKVWNTGMSAVGDPHCDENFADAGKAIVEDTSILMPEIKKGETAVAIFGLRPQYVILKQGASIELSAPNDEAVAYYLSQQSKDLKVEIEGLTIEEGEETSGTASADDAESL